MAGRGDWVPSRNYGVQTLISPSTIPTDFVLLSPRDATGGVGAGETAVVEDNDEVLLHRVVGQVFLNNLSGGSTLVVRERIRVGLLDNAGAAAFFSDNFGDASEANEPFLWERTQVLTAGDTNLDGGFSHPFFSFVDIRSKRKLQRQQALFYSVSFSGTNDLGVTLFLRCWASARG